MCISDEQLLSTLKNEAALTIVIDFRKANATSYAPAVNCNLRILRMIQSMSRVRSTIIRIFSAYGIFYGVSVSYEYISVYTE